MSSDKHTVAIIGYGGMGKFHGQLIRENGQLEVAGSFDLLEARQEASVQAGFRAYKSFEEVLADSSVEVVVIATPNEVHKEIAIRAFEAGKHVVCEKPAAMSSEELKAMIAAADKAGRVLMVHQNRRWDEDFRVIRQMYERETIGALFQIESRVHGANGIPGDWRHVKEHGGGMLLDWGVHLLDQLLFMIDSKVVSVFSTMSYILGNEVDDGFEAVLQFENGIKAIVEVGTTNFIPLPRWYVKGTEGSAVIEDWFLNGRIVTRNRESEQREPAPVRAGVGLTKTMAPPRKGAAITEALPPAAELPDGFYSNFVAVIEDTAEPIVKNAEVLRVQILIEAIFAAAACNEVIKGFDTYGA
ncbi:Gfo/Idh/MocA family oxidoreductase [Paenibacillus borealis]|uniref:Dehydrogenase n=1 Tax=Paenibacillus borealis TaxID=160799 RepID=A0A089LCL7_PAEBO|nr:Gfo/Idh/MocA family oxidoreductase [Paenibacillus borealis]AIQ57825.1 dehydrogenase [Paenibacillus borealis]